ncbi:MAG: hypothetical protein LBD22_05975, partial [Spirochaetaceae bacterium]|nr:hypothetical protein [Spirochaetaceae bacterium]
MLFRRLLITFFLISGSFSVLYAREIAIHVEDADLEMALEGAHVYTWDGRDIICNAEGNARLLVPDSETVMVRISYPGYRTERVLIPPSRIGRLTVSMRIESLLENKELVFTAEKKHEGTEVTTGRSVALAGRELSRTSEIGFIEDVMTAVKLLPGVGYSGMFNAMPSIRGGEPGDLIAAFDGFYIDFPYFWGGGMSIFDPHMIQSVKLSHGIFSTRYGHTISGLLELTSKKPSSTEIEVELGISTSALNLNVSVPINRKGGFMVMGKVTYWDGYLALIKALANVVDEFKDANAITTAPYIRVAAFNGSYRFTNAFELSLNGFIGGDGVAAEYNNQLVINGITQDINSAFIWDNLQGFLIAGTTYNPRSSMVVKTTLGSGFTKMLIYGDLHDDLHLTNSPQFIADMISQYPLLPASMFPADYRLNQHDFITNDTVTYTGQGRVDYDWDMGKGFLFAAGVQELYTHWTRYIFLSGPTEKPPPNSYPPLNL